MALDYPAIQKTGLIARDRCPRCDNKNLRFIAVLEGVDGPYSVLVCGSCIKRLAPLDTWSSVHEPKVGQHHVVYYCSDGRYVMESWDVPKYLTATKRLIRVDAAVGFRITRFTDISWPVGS